MKSALITVTTWRFERIVKVFRVYIANICWLPLCCYGYSLNLPICRSRVRIPQGFFSSWTVVQFKKKDFPPKLIFFFYSKSKTCKKSISLEVRVFFQVVEDPYHVWKKKYWFSWGSNPGPFACEANVITTTLLNQPHTGGVNVE